YDTEFSNYNNIDFKENDQVRLRNKLVTLSSKFMMIIKNTKFIYDLYKDTDFHIEAFDKNYQVSFQNRNDKKVTHLVITNYKKKKQE
ncbi:DNA adenine methylase, partial [Lactococcus petauri]